MKSETSALTTCIGWQKHFDSLYHPGCVRFRWRRELVDDPAIRSEKILVEILLGFAHKLGRMRRLAIEGMGSLTFDADLVRQG